MVVIGLLMMMRKLKNKKCQLCNKITKEGVRQTVGGCVNYTHDSCVKIVERYIDYQERFEQIRDVIQHKLDEDEEILLENIRMSANPEMAEKNIGELIEFSNKRENMKWQGIR